MERINKEYGTTMLIVTHNILLLYLAINTVLVKRLNKFTPAEVLKNRE